MDVIESRMKRAKEEAKGIENYDYLIVNDDLEECVKEMHQIISGEHKRCFTPSLWFTSALEPSIICLALFDVANTIE